MANLPEFNELTSIDLSAAMGPAIAVGLLYCFLGYRLLRFILGLTGFLLAGIVGAAMASIVSEGQLLVTTVAFLLAGIAGTLAFSLLYKAGVFCLGMLGTALVAQTVMLERAEQWPVYAVLGIGALGGLLALVAERPIMTIVTAIIGGAMTTCGAAYFLVGPTVFELPRDPMNNGRAHWMLLGTWMLLALVGALAQLSAQARRAAKLKEKAKAQ